MRFYFFLEIKFFTYLNFNNFFLFFRYNKKLNDSRLKVRVKNYFSYHKKAVIGKTFFPKNKKRPKMEHS